MWRYLIDIVKERGPRGPYTVLETVKDTWS